MFEHPTVAALAARAGRGAVRERPPSPAPSLERGAARRVDWPAPRTRRASGSAPEAAAAGRSAMSEEPASTTSPSSAWPAASPGAGDLGELLGEPAPRRGLPSDLSARRGAGGRPACPRELRESARLRAPPRRAAGRRAVRRPALRRQPARGAHPRPAAAGLPGVRLGGAGGRRLRPRPRSPAPSASTREPARAPTFLSQPARQPRGRRARPASWRCGWATTRTSWPPASPTG